jgi:hypothetical protein
MSKTKFLLTTISIVGLGALCLYLNRDWFAKTPIQISHRVSPWLRPAPGRRANPLDKANPVIFSLNGFYKLTEIKVVIAADLATNKYAHPLWHLVSDSNSVFTASFGYGERIRGLRPADKGATPDLLDPGVQYYLTVKTADAEAGHDFSTTAKP